MASIFGPMTDARKTRIWTLWRGGIPMSEIARDIAKPPATVYSYLLYHGGIEPRQHIRRQGSLSLEERETISRELASGASMRSIAKSLNRSASTISREISRNGGITRYRAWHAEAAFFKRCKRPKSLLLRRYPKLCRQVIALLKQDWSPEQISGWLRQENGTGVGMSISHETIYKSLFIQTRGVLREELKKHLRMKRMFRRARNHQTPSRGNIQGAVSIRERPAEIEDRAIPGHWEGDLIVGSLNSAIATIVERHSRFTLLCKVKNKGALTVIEALAGQMHKLPRELSKSLTWDRGQELSAHKAFSLATDMAVYFCDPSSPWQRGTNENTNGLLRQYFPKGTCLSGFSQKELDKIAEKLNTRPRKTLKFKTPAQVLQAALQ
ncbi:IS30 family transposase [Robbsia andropogonis]|uniref:IS30 family transposase n=1 Tax=Robbsia andropogonis TaxID=28092 RepID=UPI00158F1872|nr:IS30 family transposase [Robbsia andropogonis]